MKTFSVIRETTDLKMGSFLFMLMGCGILTLSSWVKIPLYPVSFTFHTFAIFLLALIQPPQQALGSAICYLLCGTLGLPVFAGKVHSLWMFGKCGGYLFAFPFAAYTTSLLAKKQGAILAVLAGQALIYTLGVVWLIPFVGIEISLIKGVVIFLPSDVLKGILAISFSSCWHNWRDHGRFV